MEKFKTTRGLTYDSVKSKYPEYFDEIHRFISMDDISISERIWLFQNGLYKIPSCTNESCVNDVLFIKFSRGYRKYCSRKCAAIDTHKNEDIKTSRINKMLESNYDSDRRISMTEKANLTKSNFSDIKNKEINNKREITNLLKWGVNNVSKNLEIKKKISKKLKSILPDIREKKTSDMISNLGFVVISVESEIYKLKCIKCNNAFDISKALFSQRKRFNISICLSCNPNDKCSDFERKIYEYISSVYNGEIIKNFRNSKKYEIDIYLPELKIGFECNGLWWHSDRYKEKNYHVNKTDLFMDNDNIRIIHIWEDDWKYKKDIICSRILNMLNNSKRIYARNCYIKNINSDELSRFLIDNHIQGKVNSKIKLGLYHNNDLVSVMSFGSFRKNLGRKSAEKKYELLRFCNKKSTTVVGGASKLFKYFIINFSPEEVISYASRDWSIGELYSTLGFSYIKRTEVNYFYFHKDIGIRMNRYNFRKDKLVREGYDKNMTEQDIMINRGYYRIYDTGSLLFEYKP
jgi:hypothetical protein